MSSPMPRLSPVIIYAYLAAVLIFIYLPIFVMMAMGFNESAHYDLPMRFSLKWYEALA